MKVNDAALKVERSGNFQEKGFRIKASRKAFDILSSQIYSDVKLAIVRELSTNAWDAHVEAGTTDTPFHVHLPNAMEPHFSIRDFGTGLSRDDIESLYTTYFESNKTHSNDFTGCLGIGSKSPFAYTDNFTVISYFEGVKYTYSAFRGEEGFPQIALLGQTKTEEANGLEIIIAIKKDDMNDFLDRARKVYVFFGKKPVVTGVTDFESVYQEIQLEGEGWKLFKQTRQNHQLHYNRPKTCAVMGNVGYPLKADYSYGFTSRQRNLIEAGFHIDFPIGELEIAASREELQYTPETISAIKIKLDEVSSNLAKVISEEFASCSSLWDARLKYRKLFQDRNSPTKYLNNLIDTKQIKWKTNPCNSIFSFDLRNFNFLEIDLFRPETGSRGIICRRTENVASIESSENVIFVIDDLQRGSISRSATFLRQKENSDKVIYLLKRLPEKEDAKKPSQKTLTKDEKEFFSQLGIKNPLKSEFVRLASSFPKTESKRITNAAVKSNKITVDYFMPGRHVNYQYPENSWREETIDPKTDAGIYVNIRRWRLIDHKDQPSHFQRCPSDINKICDLLVALDSSVDIPKVYGLKIGYSPKIVKTSKNWKHLNDYAKEIVEKQIKLHNLEEEMKNYQELHSLKNKAFWEKISKKCGNNSFSKISDRMVETRIEAKIKKIQELNNLIKLKLDLNFRQDDLRQVEDKLYKKYPMLKFVQNSYYSLESHTIDACVDYVNMIDTYSKEGN